jgi:hypothetical protein
LFPLFSRGPQRGPPRVFAPSGGTVAPPHRGKPTEGGGWAASGGLAVWSCRHTDESHRGNAKGGLFFFFRFYVFVSTIHPPIYIGGGGKMEDDFPPPESGRKWKDGKIYKSCSYVDFFGCLAALVSLHRAEALPVSCGGKADRGHRGGPPRAFAPFGWNGCPATQMKADRGRRLGLIGLAVGRAAPRPKAKK